MRDVLHKLGRFILSLRRAALPALILPLGGCAYLGIAANAVPKAPVAAAYPGLKGQRVGIMVWAESGIEMDHPELQSDVSRGLESKLQIAAGAGAKEVKEVRWVKPDVILKFQEDHPELQYESAQTLALHLPVTRLIYIEIVSFSLHPNDSVDLSRGEVLANLRVVEVAGGKAHLGYEEENVTAIFPPHSPPEGVLNRDDDDMYHQTVSAFTTELAKRFITHEADVE